MHIEVLVEDSSGAAMMEILLPKLLGEKGKHHTWRIFNYKGIGHIPKKLTTQTDAKIKTLLDKLPSMLQGYAQTPGYDAVIVLVDTDRRQPNMFRRELDSMKQKLNQSPKTVFCLATEEVEAWYLGDRGALLNAYPKANKRVLNRYQQDSVCGTWELLADAVIKGGSEALKKEGFYSVGAFKHECAERITPHMKLDTNHSPSFKDAVMRVHALIA